ncbi:MAG TPA: DUF3592 domain-containing protein [Herpetosiphonaceae bacterium]|nr:DUF3592 domain-containing protein [Herpetosiphonaceae bacterium]
MLIVFLLGGALGLGIGLWLAGQTCSLIRRGAHAQGRYVDTQWRGSGSGGEVSQYGQIEFQTAQGRIVRFSSRVGALGQRQNSGAPVPVLYDPANPDDAVVNSFVELWMPAIIFGGVGAAWMIAATIALILA